MKKVNIILTLLLILSCSKDEGNPNPSATSLIFPDNNQECNQGIDVSGTNRSTVTFRWSASAKTDSYDVFLKNLNTLSTISLSSLTTELAITIDKGTPYSWYVISKNMKVLETAQSETWKFYNAGDPIASYAPFPADLIAPAMASTLTGITSQNLSWSGSDIDNDIVSYDVYFDISNPPTALEGNTSSSNMDVTVAAGNTYYWRVVTKDSQGNNSQSEIFEFRVE
ncbi:hypothetical protein EB822_11105 [Flavobacteriaceae bacterium PRS1]|nr:hypothetical protein EB822_11105 [Flavobacteriaceae bacterium PRS1]